MAQIDRHYHQLLRTILTYGYRYTDRTRAGVGLRQLTTWTLDIPMLEFPLLTTKQVSWKTVAHELVWIMSGAETIDYLRQNQVKIWDKDVANFSGEGSTYAGRIYGPQLRSFQGDVDQIWRLVQGLRESPFNRRHVVTMWNPAELHLAALPPCFWAFEVLPEHTKYGLAFTLKWHQRSVDTFLGLPFDMVWFGFLGKLIEHETGMRFNRLIGDLSNVHIYEPHLPAVRQQLARKCYRMAPTVRIAPEANMLMPKASDFQVENYNSAGPIKASLLTQTTS